MKLRLALISLALAGILATPAIAAETVAVINYQQILRDSTAGRSVKEQLDTKQRSFQAEMSKKEDELNKEQKAIEQQRAVLSQDAFEKKAKDFSIKMKAAQRDVQTKRAALDDALISASNQIQKAVLDIVSNLSKQRGYSMVIPSSQLLYADPKLDITSDVLSQLNSTLPKVTVSFRAATSPASSGGDNE